MSAVKSSIAVRERGGKPSIEIFNKCGNPSDETKLVIDQIKPANDLMNALFKDSEVKEFLARMAVAMGLHNRGFV